MFLRPLAGLWGLYGAAKKKYTLYLGAKPTIAMDRNMGHGMNCSRYYKVMIGEIDYDFIFQ